MNGNILKEISARAEVEMVFTLTLDGPDNPMSTSMLKHFD